MDILNLPPKLPVAVEKPTPYTFDLGLLLTTDANPLTLPTSTSTPEELEQTLAETARDSAQALINQLLTTCPVTQTADGAAVTLPPVSTPLPREKPLPAPKQMTRWERFAKKKGITPKTRDQRRNLAYDEDTAQWRPKWGLGGANKKGEDDWLVEVDVNKERAAKAPVNERKEGREERKERVRRNERRMKKNELHAQGKGKRGS